MINENWRGEVLRQANSYCAKHGIMLSTLANKIVKDADFFAHLKSGGGCNVDTLQRVLNWFEKNAQPEKKRSKHNGVADA